MRSGEEGCAVRTVRASHESFGPPLLLMLRGEQIYRIEGSLESEESREKDGERRGVISN